MGIFNKTIVLKSSDTCHGNDCKKFNEDAVREIAYFRWLTSTGGSPVTEEESLRFWLEAEKELSKQKQLT